MSTQDQSPEEIAALKADQEKNTKVVSLLMLLMALVYRAGGELVIENLSEFANKRLGITMKIDEENDRAILKVAARTEFEGDK